jgi:hypothetical protein
VYFSEVIQRITDYIQFQIMEVLLPGVITFEKLYEPQKLRDFAIDRLVFLEWGKIFLCIHELKIQVPSSENRKNFLELQIKETNIRNKQSFKKRLYCNNEQYLAQIFPLKDIESESWIIEATNCEVGMIEECKASYGTNTEYQGGSLVSEYDCELSNTGSWVRVTDKFDIDLEVNIPKKLHELRHIYHLVTDPLEFDQEKYPD